jgi:quinol monooxygenase YgiN
VLANQETTTPVWFARQLGPSTFGIFDAFSDEAGRNAHLAGPIASALMANAPNYSLNHHRLNMLTFSQPRCQDEKNIFYAS